MECEKIAQLEKQIEELKAELAAGKEESKPKYKIRCGGFPYRHPNGDNMFYPDLPYQIELKTGPIGIPTIAAFCDESTARRVCDVLNREEV